MQHDATVSIPPTGIRVEVYDDSTDALLVGRNGMSAVPDVGDTITFGDEVVKVLSRQWQLGASRVSLRVRHVKNPAAHGGGS